MRPARKASLPASPDWPVRATNHHLAATAGAVSAAETTRIDINAQVASKCGISASSALITLDVEMLPAWLKNNGEDGELTLAEASVNPKVIAEVQRAAQQRGRSNTDQRAKAGERAVARVGARQDRPK